MSTAQLDNSNVSKVLGKTVDYPDQYDPSILVREPRQSNRKHLNFDDGDLPFCGYDIWNAYEVSCLTKRGFPVTGIAKIVYPCDNKYIVESKSLKLYFNSFNMTQLGETADQARDAIREFVANDLAILLQTDIHVNIFAPEEINSTKLKPYFHDSYCTLENIIEANSWHYTQYTEEPKLLNAGEFSITAQPYMVSQR